jgi:hypothetical protein
VAIYPNASLILNSLQVIHCIAQEYQKAHYNKMKEDAIWTFSKKRLSMPSGFKINKLTAVSITIMAMGEVIFKIYKP